VVVWRCCWDWYGVVCCCDWVVGVGYVVVVYRRAVIMG